MQHLGDYRRKYYVVLSLVSVLIYFKLYSRADSEKKTQPSSSSSPKAFKMNHDHDHAAMIASSSPSMSHDHQTQANMNTGGHGLNMMMMAMTFHGGVKESILFEEWTTSTTGPFIASWIVIFVLAIFYEGLKTYRDVLAKRGLCDACAQTQNRSGILAHTDNQQRERSSEDDLISSVRAENQQMQRARLLSLPHMVQTLLHIVQMTISYGLMLIAMTFNTYLLLAIILGAGFGHFLFGWRRSSVLDHNEHCH